jgi:hypothetical protein
MKHLDQACYTSRTEASLSRLDVVVMTTGAALMLAVFVLMLSLPNWN